MVGLGNGRRSMKSPPLILAALVACVIVLGFNYWIASSRSVELQVVHLFRVYGHRQMSKAAGGQRHSLPVCRQPVPWVPSARANGLLTLHTNPSPKGPFPPAQHPVLCNCRVAGRTSLCFPVERSGQTAMSAGRGEPDTAHPWLSVHWRNHGSRGW